jgi:hypothetical protein
MTTPYFLFDIPEALELQGGVYGDIGQSQVGNQFEDVSYYCILQSKSIDGYDVEGVDSSFCRIMISIDTLDDYYDNNSSRLELQSASKEELQAFSDRYEAAVRKNQTVTAWYGISLHEIDGLFAYRFSYDYASSTEGKGVIHADCYLINNGYQFFNIAATYSIEGISKWLPVTRKFVSSQLHFTDNSVLFGRWGTYHLYDSKESFLWDTDPVWQSDTVQTPESATSNVHILTTAKETFPDKGYQIYLTVLDGIADRLTSSSMTDNLLSSEQMDIKDELTSNTQIHNLVITTNSIDKEKQVLVITYTYMPSNEESIINGATILKVTEDKKIVYAVVDWLSEADSAMNTFIDSIVEE